MVNITHYYLLKPMELSRIKKTKYCSFTMVDCFEKKKIFPIRKYYKVNTNRITTWMTNKQYKQQLLLNIHNIY